eukprot:jgi/Chrzof1/8318/Cz03g06010.t1
MTHLSKGDWRTLPGAQSHGGGVSAAAAASLSSSAARRLQGASAILDSCRAIAANVRCDDGSQFNCCKSADNQNFYDCIIWDNNQYCPSERGVAACCSA